MKKGSRITTYIIIALIIGIVLGFVLNKNIAADRIENITEPFSLLPDVFLRLIKMIVAPLVFFTLVVGVAKLGDVKAVGRIGAKTLLWFVCASLISLLLGMLLVNIFKPGIAMHLPLPAKDAASVVTGG